MPAPSRLPWRSSPTRCTCSPTRPLRVLVRSPLPRALISMIPTAFLLYFLSVLLVNFSRNRIFPHNPMSWADWLRNRAAPARTAVRANRDRSIAQVGLAEGRKPRRDPRPWLQEHGQPMRQVWDNCGPGRVPRGIQKKKKKTFSPVFS